MKARDICYGIEWELAWSSLNQGLWLPIRIHFTPLNQDIKEILTQKHQYNAKYLSRFNDKNAFRK